MKLKNNVTNALLNLTHNMVIAIDCNNKIVIFNKMAEETFSVKESDILGKFIDETDFGEALMKVMSSSFVDDEDHCNSIYTHGYKTYSVTSESVTEDNKTMILSLFNDITANVKLSKQHIDDEIYIDVLNTIMETANEWTVVVDELGVITMMSKGYREFLGKEKVIGLPATEVIDNSRLYEVIKTGESEIGEIMEIKGNKLIAMRIPIKKNGRIVGAIGKVMFKDVDDFYTLGRKLNNLEKEVEYYKNKLESDNQAKYSIDDIIGNSEKMLKVKKMISKSSKTDSNVLITGPSGTGKELVAHAIHNTTKRRIAPFVKVNCAAIPAELLESELFGYEEGAFTGAKKGGKKGKFLLADGGTILLDEIGDMPLSMQAKLLRVLQEKEVEKIGSSKPQKISVRVIASTNRNIEDMVTKKTFREDLYYRLNVMRIEIPSLKDRNEDIPAIAISLKKKISDKLGIYIEGISKEAMNFMCSYDWPGNIRELENVIERSLNLLDAELQIIPELLPSRITSTPAKSYYKKDLLLKTILEDVEKEVLSRVFQDTHGNKNQTAKKLGISRPSLYSKLAKYEIVE